MKINAHTLVLKSIPYLLSIAGGIILYTGAVDNAPNPNVQDLIINVSASLLSIPLVFLLYDYTNSRIARQMNKHLSDSVSDKLNGMTLNLIMLLRSILSVRSKLTLENINRMLIMRGSVIGGRLKITPADIQQLRDIHAELETLLYHGNAPSVLSGMQIQILTSLSRDMIHLVNENRFRGDKRLTVKYIENLMARLTDWLDSDSVARLNLQENLTPDDAEMTKKAKK
ncbi:MAG: hypothetical protein J6S06_03530 [Alphaproteobacteria bacterium]|nr:hypothetical protein [Alphaproteobacteria bacterium]MBR5575525.1 hypothetical protein [Alphaproteobacteria bacterium]